MQKADTKPLREILRDSVRKALKANGLKANATVLRDKAKIGQGVAADILNGVADVRLSTVEKICAKFGATGPEFLQPDYQPKTDLSKDEAEGLEKIRAAIASLSPGQRKALALSEELQKVISGTNYDSEKMSPEWDARNKK
jgi:hypothetical protein